MRRFLSILVVLASLFAPLAVVSAQDSAPEGLVYVVQEGDNLWEIALRFGVSVEDLMAANGIGADGNVNIGATLVIPGFENLGFTGVLNTVRVGFGEDLQSLSRRTGVPADVLARLNRLVSPSEIYAGMPFVLVENAQELVGSPEGEAAVQSGSRPLLGGGQSLLELAVLRNANPWSLVQSNQLVDSQHVVPGQVLWLPGSGSGTGPGPGGLPDSIQSIQIDPLPFVQGTTAQFNVAGEPGMKLGGTFNNQPLNFFSNDLPGYVALQGVHALTEPGFYPIVITGTLATGESFGFSQSVYIKGGDYPYDPVLTVSPETIDPAVTKPEDAQWKALVTPVTAQKYWQGKFQAPVPKEFAECYPSRFGNRRAYNDGLYNYFHTGLDFCGNTTTEVLAPAGGTVVFAGPLTVRGNATIIDHGWGVYTGYLHQSELFVKAGDVVEAGQRIGLVGATGRVTGPHLHWEVWVGGAQVDPLDWLTNIYPSEPEISQ